MADEGNESAAGDWSLLRPVLEDLVPLGPEEREAALQEQLPTDALRQRAREFLADSDALDDSTADPLARLPLDLGVGTSESLFSARGAAPDHAGPWEFRRKIGAGGMGEVWLAVRTDGGFTQRAAVKRLHDETSSEEVLARFARERQVLAAIEDPAIARLIDGGVDETGRPYIAMEFVDGEPIDVWCDARHLGIRSRVELLVRVAHAVDAAHERHVVHRDLKPSNVLVDGSGRPRLIDFGVAKVLDPMQDSALVTRDAARYLTPTYASPEQFEGRAPTPASDVYSLGVLAYVLLAGKAPLELTGMGAAEAVRAVRDERPALLAEAAVRAGPEAAERRGTTVKALGRTLGGDLETVVQYCLRKDAARRYGRARDLGQDLERWLGGRPVLARRDRLSYRARRFVGRHSWLVGGTLTALALLSVALVQSQLQRRRLRLQAAELQQRTAEAEGLAGDLQETIRELNSTFYRELARVDGNAPIVARMAESLAETASRYRDPVLLSEAATAYAKVGHSTWWPFKPAPAAPEKALRAFERSKELALTTLDEHGYTRERMAVAAEAYAKTIDAQWRLGELDAALAHATEADAWFEWIRSTRSPCPSGAVINQLYVTYAAAQVLATLGKPRAAVQRIDDALRALSPFPPPEELVPAAMQRVAADDLLTIRADMVALARFPGPPELPEGWWQGAANGGMRSTETQWRSRYRAAEERFIAGDERAVLEELRGAVADLVQMERASRRPHVATLGAEAQLALGRLELRAGHPERARAVGDALLAALEETLGGREWVWIEAEAMRGARLLSGRAHLACGDMLEGARLVGLSLDLAETELGRRPRNIRARLGAIAACAELAALQPEGPDRAPWIARGRALIGGVDTGPGYQSVVEEAQARLLRLESGNR